MVLLASSVLEYVRRLYVLWGERDGKQDPEQSEEGVSIDGKRSGQGGLTEKVTRLEGMPHLGETDPGRRNGQR